MPKTYADRIESRHFGSRLIIYHRPELKTGHFWYRAKIPKVAGYIRRSTGAGDSSEAMIIAEEAYEDLMFRQKGGLSLTRTTFGKFFYDWIQRKRHRFTEQRRKWKIGVYERYLKNYLGDRDLSGLTKQFCDGYWDYRAAFWTSDEGKQRIRFNKSRLKAKTQSSHNVAKKPAFATLRAEASLLNEILQAAVDEGHLIRSIKVSAQDAVPKNERGSGYRATFTDHEWNVLTTNLYNYARCRGRWKSDRLTARHKFQRLMLRAFVLFAASTGMRTGEIKQLRWGDIEIKNNETLVARVRKETSKVRRERAVVAHSPNIIKVLEEYKKESKHTKDSDLLFYNENKNGIGFVDLSTNFKTFLKNCEYENRKDGLLYSADGKPRTAYSLRHFYAVQRLKQNVGIYPLADNMGTGSSHIRKHYARHISADSFIKELTKMESRSRNKTQEAVREIVDLVESGTLDEEAALNTLKRVASIKS